MSKTKRARASCEKAERLTIEQAEPIIESLASTLAHTAPALDKLFLIATELKRHCQDWMYVEAIAGELQRQLLVFTDEVDEAAIQCEARVRKQLTVGHKPEEAQEAARSASKGTAGEGGAC